MHRKQGMDAMQKSATPSISIVLPAWNEQEVICQAIREADEALRVITDHYEILVVDDGSTDQTASLVLQAAKLNSSVRLIQHNPNQGYGAALRTGFAAAKCDLVVFSDADCQFDLGELDRFLLLSQKYDIVCGYRIDRKDTALRCLYSRVYNQLVRILLRTEVRDVDCALKMFHRKVVQNLPISGNGFLVNSEILTQAKRRGHRIVEVGVSHRWRTDGQSTVSIAHIPKVLVSLARYWWNTIQFPASEKQPVSRTDHPNVTSDKSATSDWTSWSLLFAAIAFFAYRFASAPTNTTWTQPFNVLGVVDVTQSFAQMLSVMATALATVWFGRRIADTKTGVLGAALLLLSSGVVFTQQLQTAPIVMSCLVVLSLFCAFASLSGQRLNTQWWLLSGLLCGLACLTNGWISLVLYLPAIVTFASLNQSNAKLSASNYWLLLGVIAAVSTPALFWRLATSTDHAVASSLLRSTSSTQVYGGSAGTIVFYVAALAVVGTFAFSFLSVPYCKAWRDSNQSHRSSAIGGLFLWSIWCLVCFLATGTASVSALMVAAPAVALMTSYLLQRFQLSWQSEENNMFFCWASKLCTASLAGILILFHLHPTPDPNVSNLESHTAMQAPSEAVQAFLVVNFGRPTEQLRQQLPSGTQVIALDRQTMANLIHAKSTPSVERIAEQTFENTTR